MAGRSWTRVGTQGVAAGGGIGVLAALSAPPAAAHEVGGTRFDAPLPLPLLFLGAAATVALTALWLARPDTHPSRDRPIASVELPAVIDRVGRWVVRPLFGFAVATAVLAGLFGRQVAAENAATLFVWPVWFRGLALVAVLVGTPWPLLSPWRAVYRLLEWLEGDAIALVGAYPTRLAEWPALAGLVVLFGVLEPLTTIPSSPRLTAVVVVVYAAAMVGGALAVGPTWLRRADPLGVLYRLLGRVAPLTVTREPGVRGLSLSPPWRGCRRPVDTLALAVVVVTTVYTVSFDGFTSTLIYTHVLAVGRALLGPGPAVPIFVYGIGLAAFLAAFAAVSVLADRLGTGSAGPGAGSPWAAARAFAPSVLPIAAAYEVAHNYPYVFRSLGHLWPVVAGPLVPIADPVALLGWLSLRGFWWSQVLLVVAGHAVAVVAAHRAATDRYDSPSAARRAHFPLVVLMVAYTVVSLWIVSQPVVR